MTTGWHIHQAAPQRRRFFILALACLLFPAVAGAQAIIQAHITDAIDERERKRAEEKAQRPAAAKGKASASSASSTPSRAAKRLVARDDPALAVYGGFEGGESVYGSFKGEDVLHAPVGHRPPAGQPYCDRFGFQFFAGLAAIGFDQVGRLVLRDEVVREGDAFFADRTQLGAALSHDLVFIKSLQRTLFLVFGGHIV